MKGLTEPYSSAEAKACWLGYLSGVVTGIIIGFILFN